MINYYNLIVQEDMADLFSRSMPYQKLRNKSVLITGANGMLATYLVYFFMYLNEKDSMGIKIYALVRNKEKALRRFEAFLDKQSFILLEQDVCMPIHIDTKIDYIVHAAGGASPKAILSDPVGIIRANTLGTMNVLELAKKSKVKNILFTSTREVYGKMTDETSNISEGDLGILNQLELRSCYPESKRMAENIFVSYGFQFGIQFSIARIAHSYGPGMDIENDGRIMSDLIGDVVCGRNIKLKSTGEAKRAFCYITDAIAALLLVLLNEKSGEVYNIANETEEFSIRDTAELLVDLFPQKKLKVIFDIPEKKSIGYSSMGRVKLNTKNIEALGWSPLIQLTDGMKRTVQSFEN